MSRWTTPQKLPNDTSSRGPKVLAAGLWRCTTSSLQFAFEELCNPPLRPSMHGTYILTNVPLMRLCVHASMETAKPKRQAMLHQIFNGYNGSSDYPGMAFVDDLMEMYPDMKIVLNTRSSADAWAKSANENLRFFSTWKYALICGLIPMCYWHWQLYRQYEKMAKRRFGEDTDIWSEEYYEMHNMWIESVAKENEREVFEWQPPMGWEPLCDFIGVKVPQQEFPRLNDAAEIRNLTKYLLKCGIAAWCTVLVVVGGIGLGARSLLS